LPSEIALDAQAPRVSRTIDAITRHVIDLTAFLWELVKVVLADDVAPAHSERNDPVKPLAAQTDLPGVPIGHGISAETPEMNLEPRRSERRGR
jgi:hypothetical protein